MTIGKNRFVALLLATCIASYSTDAHAEGDLDGSSNTGLDNGSGNGLGFSVPQVTLKSGIEGEEINLTLGMGADSWNDLSETRFSVTLTAPFNKDDEIGHFVTEAGLPSTWSAGTNFSYSLTPGFARRAKEAKRAFEVLYGQAQQACKKQFVGKPDELKKCDGNDRAVAELIKDTHPDIFKQMDETRTAIILNSSNVPFVGISANAKIGRDVLAFRDPISFAEQKAKRTPFSFGVSLGWIPNISKPLGIFVGGQYRESFKLPDAETRCPVALGGAASVTCFKAAFGPPNKETDATTFSAIRLDGTLSKSLPVSAEVKFAYDWQDEEWGVSAPIYFFRNKDEALNGGFKVEYDNGKKDWSFGVFIGTTFDFLKL